MPIEYEDTVSAETGTCDGCGVRINEDENWSEDSWLCHSCWVDKTEGES